MFHERIEEWPGEGENGGDAEKSRTACVNGYRVSTDSQANLISSALIVNT